MLQRLAEAIGRLRGRVIGLGPPDDLGLYAQRYEWHALKSSRARAVGGADFDLVGAIELGLLQQEGLGEGVVAGHLGRKIGCVPGGQRCLSEPMVRIRGPEAARANAWATDRAACHRSPTVREGRLAAARMSRNSLIISCKFHVAAGNPHSTR